MKLNYYARLQKIENHLDPPQKAPIVIQIESKNEIDLDQIRKDYNNENGCKHTFDEWKMKDVIVTRTYTEGDLKDWIFETITTTGENEDTIYKKYPKLYKQYLEKNLD